MTFRVLSRFQCFGLLATLLAFSTPNGASAEQFSFFHEHVLGTSLEIQVEAETFAAARQAEGRILTEIERLSAIFSSYDPNSELSRWQSTHGVATQVSAELFDALAASANWQSRSEGAFNPAVQALTQLWTAAAKQQTLPGAAELQATATRIQQSQYHLDVAQGTATRLGTAPLSLNAIAKGDILDRVCSAGRSTPAVHGVLVAIGGDMRLLGDIAQPVHVTDPQHDAVNAAPLTTIHLHNRGLATSGGYRRGVDIAGQHYSHILDPRTGQPMSEIASATVIAPTARDADALATIFSVLSPAESAELAAQCAGVEYFLVTKNGQRLTSPGWHDFEQPQLFRLAAAAKDQLAQADAPQPPAAETKAAEPTLLELQVQFELAKPAGSQYRRPYVAVWLEDADEFPVRTAVLWMQTKQPGPRWHRDLLRWYRHDAVRKLADKRDLIGTISGATRGSGQYKAVFDGKDDAGNPLPPGKYTLFIEVAREHGTYQLIRHPLTLGAEPIAATKLKSNVEIQSATVEYRAAAPAQPAGN